MGEKIQTSQEASAGEGRPNVEYPAPGRRRNDPYRVLGVGISASRQEIARAYRRAVQRAHPDAQPTDPRAAARFRELTDAYDLLSDPARRAAYDRTHHPAAQPSSQPPPPRYPGAALRQPGSPHLLVPPHGQPIWAGPVHIEPPAASASRQDPAGAPAREFEDPPVILGTWPSRRWRRLW
jgi:curved DNA-binding protein CbpA